MNFRLQSRHTLTLLGVLAIALAVLSGTLLFEFRSLTRDMQNASSEAISTALQEDAKGAGIALGIFSLRRCAHRSINSILHQSAG